MDDYSTHTGEIVSVNISTEKGTVKRPVPRITIDERGVVGDAHAGNWDRQVSILAWESIERFSVGADRRFQCGEFAENLTVRGLDLGQTAILDTFQIGEVILEVRQLGKACHGDRCAIFQEVGRCVMPKEGLFCRVIKGGSIELGATITHVMRPFRIRVITLSDRVNQGEYEDRSGPRIVERLKEFFQDKRWHPRIESVVLPDEAAPLRDEIETACKRETDLIITTGGTGLGPRDITPDVVAEMADKLIPGVMDSIRLKYGLDNPNALLSRSIAAVVGSTLIYTLPGSVKAVDEYLCEIFKTLEHTFCMLHGLGHH